MNIAATARPEPLFVGDHLAIDFLNTVATPEGGAIDWLTDGSDLIDWLARAGAIETEVAGRFRPDPALDRVAGEARALRDWLRGFVGRHEGHELSGDLADELAPLNRLLARDDSHLRVETGAQAQMRRVRRWTGPEQLLQPIAEAIADLVCQADFRLIRDCEGPVCTLKFLDKTKAHGRRWCSMGLCGNRAKVAAHRARAADKNARAANKNARAAGEKQ
jgi:predicted RNA-binding Zn ribbon-like protein